MADDLTPWEEEELRARRLSSPLDAVWDNGQGNSQIVNPASTPYPPPYDPGPSAMPDDEDG